MEDYIPLSKLNDFIFCPYSIYLHSVYEMTDDDLYKAKPQLLGTRAHEGADNKTGSTRKADVFALPVISHTLGITGKIDVYKSDRRLLIERKNNLKTIYRGQLYQIWGQFFCMTEMGYEIEKLAFYEVSTNKMTYLDLPGEEQRGELKLLIDKMKAYNVLETPIEVNPNKCQHCIYCNLCDKTDTDNVYS